MIHHYYKIRISDRDFPKRFYRVLAVKPGISVMELGAVIAQSVGADFEHMYLFDSGNTSYVHSSWIDDWDTFRREVRDYGKYNIESLGDKFLFEYDTGEGYVFDCKVYKKLVDIDDEDYIEEDYYDEDPILAHYLDGRGAGIFENNHYALACYLAGELSDEDSETDDGYPIMPDNLYLEKLSDFDTVFDAEMEDPIFKSDISMIIDHLDSDFGMYGVSSDDEDFDDEDFDEDFDFDPDFFAFETTLALAVIKDDELNKEYDRLIKTHGSREAYEMILDTFLGIIRENNGFEESESLEVEEFFNQLIEKIKEIN